MANKKDIEILRVTHLRGPNIWTYRPVIEAWVDIGELEDFPSNTLVGFYECYTNLLPTLIEHHCSPGVRGGFLQRLREGTYAAHIMEHTAHHVDMSIPLYRLKAAQQKLEELLPGRIVVQPFSWRWYFATARICKLYDFHRHCWTDFAGRMTSPPAPMQRV